MKKVKLLFCMIAVALVAHITTAQAQNLTEAESDIHSAYLAAWLGNATALEALVDKFEKNTSTEQSKSYWEAYANYRLAIFYSASKEEDKAEEHTDKAIELLENIKKKSSDDFALLSCLTGFSIQFSPLSAAFTGPKAGKYATKAINLDEDNSRAHFARAMNDFYTPKMFGGGDLVEEHLKKAINLSTPANATSKKPTWGKDEAYEMLVQFYIREEKTDEAKMYCKMGLGQFPNDIRLKKHAKNLGLSQ